MKGSDVFPSKWLSAADLQGREVPVVIDRVLMEEVSKNEQKPVLYFRGKQKGMVVNKTNWGRIAYIVKSDDSDDWAGREVTLYTEIVDFQGRPTEAIRIKAPVRQASRQQHVVTDRGGYQTSELRRPDPIEDATGHPTRDPMDEEIPF